MITPPHKLGPPAAVALYHKAQLVNPESGLGQEAGQWLGKGAELLGLKGAVEEKAFLNVLAGLHPATGEQLTARLKANRRPGYDWVLAPHKSVSIAWGVGGDDRIAKEAHLPAAIAAFQAWERFAAARVRDNPDSKDYRITGNLVAAMFTHDTARPETEGAVSDVFLHSHFVTANLSFDAAAGEAGGWRALETNAMLEAQTLVDAVYNHELGIHLRKLGYELGVGADGKSVAIKGVPPEAVKLFSKRHEGIEKRAAEVLESGAAHDPRAVKAVVAHQGRSKKDVTTTKEELQADWRQQLRTELGGAAAERFDGVMRRALGRSEGLVPPAELTPQAFEAEFRRLTDRVAAAEKTPDREMTPEFGRWLDLHGGFTPQTLQWETPAELHQAIVAAELAKSAPVSAKAVEAYGIQLPDGCVQTGALITRHVSEAEALAWATAHCFERGSTAEVTDLLEAALRYAAGSRLVSEAGLRKLLETDERYLWHHEKMRLTTREVAGREQATVNLVNWGIDQYPQLVQEVPTELRVESTPERLAALEVTEDAEKGCPTLTAKSLRDVAGFLNRITAQADPLAKHLWDGFAAHIKLVLIGDGPLAEKQAALLEGLNVRLKERSLFTATRFAGTELSEVADKLLVQQPKGRGLERLNRVLLEAAFPRELKPAGISVPVWVPDHKLSITQLCQKFSEAQRKAVLTTVENKSFLSIFRGGAGRGKSYALVCLEKLLEREGKEVVVAAPQNDQVNSLTKDRGRPAITVASLLAMRKPLQPETVLLVDEAGQLGSQTMFALLTYAKEYNARVILSGDTAQHSSVESGDSMREIEQFTTTNRASLGTEVHEIKRQAEDWYRQVVARAEQGKPFESFQLLLKLDQAGRRYEERNPNAEHRADNARIFEFQTDAKGRQLKRAEADEARRRAVAAKAVELMLEREQLTDQRQKDRHTHLVISQTCKEVGILNEYIREGMVAAGLLKGEERVLQTLTRRKMTSAEKDLNEMFDAGTRLLAQGELCPLNNKTLIPKGSVLTYVGREHGKMVVATANGERHVLCKADTKQLAVGQLTDLKVRVGDLLRLNETLHVGFDLPGKRFKMPDGTVRRHTHKRRIANGSIVRVVGWNDKGQPMIELEGGKPRLRATLTRPILATRGYAVTSNGAQGQTVRFVLYSDAGVKDATSARSWYVDISRAIRGIWVFTNDKLNLLERIQKTGERELALELLAENKRHAAAAPSAPTLEAAADLPEPAVPTAGAAQEPSAIDVEFGPEEEVFTSAPSLPEEESNPFLEGTQVEGEPEERDIAALRHEPEGDGEVAESEQEQPSPEPWPRPRYPQPAAPQPARPSHTLEF